MRDLLTERETTLHRRRRAAVVDRYNNNMLLNCRAATGGGIVVVVVGTGEIDGGERTDRTTDDSRHSASNYCQYRANHRRTCHEPVRPLFVNRTWTRWKRNIILILSFFFSTRARIPIDLVHYARHTVRFLVFFSSLLDCNTVFSRFSFPLALCVRLSSHAQRWTTLRSLLRDLRPRTATNCRPCSTGDKRSTRRWRTANRCRDSSTGERAPKTSSSSSKNSRGSRSTSTRRRLKSEFTNLDANRSAVRRAYHDFWVPSFFFAALVAQCW